MSLEQIKGKGKLFKKLKDLGVIITKVIILTPIVVYGPLLEMQLPGENQGCRSA